MTADAKDGGRLVLGGLARAPEETPEDLRARLRDALGGGIANAEGQAAMLHAAGALLGAADAFAAVSGAGAQADFAELADAIASGKGALQSAGRDAPWELAGACVMAEDMLNAVQAEEMDALGLFRLGCAARAAARACDARALQLARAVATSQIVIPGAMPEWEDR